MVLLVLSLVPLVSLAWNKSPFHLADFEGLAGALIICCLLLSHSKSVRLLTIVGLLFLAGFLILSESIIFGLPSVVSAAHATWWITAIIFLWLAWLFGFSRSSRVWFTKP